MPKNISWRLLVVKLQKLGFRGPYFGTKHPFMIKGGLKLRIPNQHNGDISISLIYEIIRQADISKDDWNNI